MTDETNDSAPSPPPPKQNSGGEPTDQPDLGKAAKDLWTAAKAKAKELGGKTKQAATEYQAKAKERATAPVGPTKAESASQASVPRADEKKAPDFVGDAKAKALDVWQRAPTLVIVCGVGLVLVCGSCCLCGGVLSMLPGPSRVPVTSNGRSDDDGGGSDDADSGFYSEIPDPATGMALIEEGKRRGYRAVQMFDYDLQNAHHWTAKEMTGNERNLRAWNDFHRRIVELSDDELKAEWRRAGAPVTVVRPSER